MSEPVDLYLKWDGLCFPDDILDDDSTDLWRNAADVGAGQTNWGDLQPRKKINRLATLTNIRIGGVILIEQEAA